MELVGTLIQILACLLPLLAIIAVAAIIGTRVKMKYAGQIFQNIKQGKYENMSAETQSRMRIIAAVQLITILLVFSILVGVILLAIFKVPVRLSENLIAGVFVVFFPIVLIVLGVCAFMMERIMKNPK